MHVDFIVIFNIHIFRVRQMILPQKGNTWHPLNFGKAEEICFVCISAYAPPSWSNVSEVGQHNCISNRVIEVTLENVCKS